MHIMVYGKTIKIVEVVPSCHWFWNILEEACQFCLLWMPWLCFIAFGSSWVYTTKMVTPRRWWFCKMVRRRSDPFLWNRVHVHKDAWTGKATNSVPNVATIYNQHLFLSSVKGLGLWVFSIFLPHLKIKAPAYCVHSVNVNFLFFNQMRVRLGEEGGIGKESPECQLAVNVREALLFGTHLVFSKTRNTLKTNHPAFVF